MIAPVPLPGRIARRVLTSGYSLIWLVWLSAVVEGYAIGGGAELATASDYRLMTPSSRIQFVQAKMGVSTGKAALMACEQ